MSYIETVNLNAPPPNFYDIPEQKMKLYRKFSHQKLLDRYDSFGVVLQK